MIEKPALLLNRRQRHVLPEKNPERTKRFKNQIDLLIGKKWVNKAEAKRIGKRRTEKNLLKWSWLSFRSSL